MQGLTMAVALQGKTVKEVLFQQRKPVKGRASGPSGSCYGWHGHRLKVTFKLKSERNRKSNLGTGNRICKEPEVG